MFFLYFLQKQHIHKNLVLELWSKNLKTNQNTGFFKPQYLRKNLRYEVEFLDRIRGPRKGDPDGWRFGHFLTDKGASP